MKKKEKKQSIKERYTYNTINVLNDIKDNVNYIMEDVEENAISEIKITIDIQPGELVNWHLEKKYNTTTKDENNKKQFYVWK